jgi:hypothetical protein
MLERKNEDDVDLSVASDSVFFTKSSPRKRMLQNLFSSVRE